MRIVSRLAGLAFFALGTTAVAGGASSWDMAMLLPRSPDLTGAHFTIRCTDVVRFARAAGEQAEKQAGAQRVIEASTTYRGKPAVWLITSGQSDGAWVDRPDLSRRTGTHRGILPQWRQTYTACRQ